MIKKLAALGLAMAIVVASPAIGQSSLSENIESLREVYSDLKVGDEQVADTQARLVATQDELEGLLETRYLNIQEANRLADAIRVGLDEMILNYSYNSPPMPDDVYDYDPTPAPEPESVVEPTPDPVFEPEPVIDPAPEETAEPETVEVVEPEVTEPEVVEVVEPEVTEPTEPEIVEILDPEVTEPEFTDPVVPEVTEEETEVTEIEIIDYPPASEEEAIVDPLPPSEEEFVEPVEPIFEESEAVEEETTEPEAIEAEESAGFSEGSEFSPTPEALESSANKGCWALAPIRWVKSGAGWVWARLT